MSQTFFLVVTVDDNHAHNARAACRAAAVTIAERIDHPTRAWKVEMSRLGEAEVWSGPTIDTIDTIDDAIDMTHNTARLTDAEARTIAAAWNGGDGSALYSFVSTGYIAPGLSEEVLRCRRLAIDLRDKARLNQLLSYLNNSSPRTTPVPGWSPDCNPENDNLDAQHRDERGATTDED